jgi:carboxyl-terminal processing protease
MKRFRARYFLIVLSIPFVLYAILGGFLGRALAREGTYRYLAVFQDVVTLLVNNYVEPVEMQDVMEGAIRGMMDALDPDSCYLTPEEYEAFANPGEDKEAGIGVEVAKRYYLQLAAVLPGSPAEKAGLKPGDLLKSVDGVNTRETNIIAGESLLRGRSGSKVRLMVIRGRQPEPKEYTVEREVNPTPPVAYKMLPDSTGYIRIASFRNGVAEDVAKAVEALKRQGASEMVLDVRNSFGRVAEEGSQVAELFVPGGLAARLQGRSGEKTDLVLAAERVKYEGPLVVLVNRGSSGAAEILASAIRHAQRAELVGLKTSGRSAVQKAIPLGDGAALVLSVSQYWTPDEKPLLGKGIEPSVEVEEPALGEEKVGDPILEKALEILAGERAQAKAVA